MTDNQTDIDDALALLRERGFTQDVEGRLCPPESGMSEARALFADVMDAWNYRIYANAIRAGKLDNADRAAIELLAAKLAAVRAERDA